MQLRLPSLVSAVAASAAVTVFGVPTVAQASSGGFRASYEAEQGVWGNGAREIACATCSGHERVGDLGGRRDGILSIDYVTVPTDATYTVTVYYASAKSRNLDVTVNGKVHHLTGLRSGSWSKVAHVSFRAPLHVGDVGWPNTDKFDFDNPHGLAPDVDKIVISS